MAGGLELIPFNANVAVQAKCQLLARGPFTNGETCGLPADFIVGNPYADPDGQVTVCSECAIFAIREKIVETLDSAFDSGRVIVSCLQVQISGYRLVRKS